MADVFVSYRHSDRDVVAPIAEGLERRQIDVWFDRVDIRSGERWRERIAEGIKDAQSVLVAVGPEGIAGVQAFEVDLALDRAVLEVDLPIIPLLLPGAKQEGRLWTYLATRSYVEMEGATDDDIVDRIADAVRGTSSTGLAVAVDTGREPYLGLRAYSADDADLFFGREADVDALVELCRAPGLVAVVGPSGSGKSSLVKAGLVPRLQVTSVSHLRHWRPVVVEPGADPSRGFLAALLAADDAPLLLPAETVEQCRTDPGVFTTAAMAVVQRLGEHSGLVIVVDQLEQLFTSVVDEGSRRGFGENLAALAAHCPDRVRVLVTLRSDYLDALTQLPALARAVGARHHLLTPMDRDGLRDVIQRPAWECGSSLEPRLVDEIALDVEDQPNALPLLSLALQEMWRRRQGERLTLKAYAEGGRVTGVLDGLAETAIQPLVPPHDALVRATLLRLVHFAPGAPATRRRRPLEELVVFGSDGPIVRTLVGALANARLLVVGDEGVEFAHDAVISSWTRLRDWVSAARGDEEVRQRVESAAAEWTANERSPDHLATAGMVSEVGPLVSAGRLLLTAAEQDFVRTSEHKLRRARRRRWLVGATAIVAGLAVGLAGVLWRRTNEAGAQKREAVAVRLAEQSLRTVTDRPDLGLRLATAAYASSRVPAVRSALAATLTQPAPLVGTWAPDAHDVSAAAVVPGPDGLLLGTRSGQLLSCSLAARTCRVRAEVPANVGVNAIVAGGGTLAVVAGGSLLTGPMDGVLQPLTTDGAVKVVGVDPAGGLVAAATESGAVEVRTEAGAGGPRARIQSPASAVAISSHAQLVVGASTQRAGFTVWDLAGNVVADVSIPAVHGSVYAATFDPAGEHLVTTDGSSGDVLVWSVADLRAHRTVPARLVGGDLPLVSLGLFGDRAVTVDASGAVRQLSLTDARPVGGPMTALAPLGRAPARLLAAGYRAEDERVVAVRDDEVVEWDARGLSPLHRGRSQVAGLVAIAGGPTGDELSGVTADGTVVTIDAEGAVRTKVRTAVEPAAAAAAVGAHELAVGGQGLAIVDTGTGVSRAGRSDLEVVALAGPHTTDAGRIAVATKGGEVFVLSTSDLSTVAGPFDVGPDRVTDLALSPDGTTVALGHLGPTTRDAVVIDVSTGRSQQLKAHGAEVSAVAFSPDGGLLATGSDDRTAILWSTDTWKPKVVLSGHDDRVRRLAFTATGDMLLSASDDGTMRWWSVPDGTPVGLPLALHGPQIVGLQAGATVATTLLGTTVARWDTTAARWVEVACRIADRPLTDVERSTYLERAEPACPSAG